MKKIIFYYQTFTGLKPILYTNTPVTHIHLSSVHFGNNGDNTPYIHLNDYHPDNERFIDVWKELEIANKQYGIKVILMVGGAGGAFSDLFNNFNIYYPMLKKTIETNKVIEGIDLDIEEYVSLDNVKMLINKINSDFGNEFIISMAPVQSSLQDNNPGLGGFVYKDLYNSKEGLLIDYFNTQFYFDYSLESFTDIIDNGYPEDMIVIGSISSQYQKRCFDTLKEINNKYPSFGGVFNWEYFDVKPDSNSWAVAVNNIINNYKYDLSNLETGDVVLFSSNDGFVSKLIQWYTGSKWTHVGIVLKDPYYISKKLKGYYLLESGYNDFRNIEHKYTYGVQISNLYKKIDTYPGLVKYRKINKPVENKKYIIKDIYHSIRDRPYDLSIYDFLCLKKNIQLKTNQYNIFYSYLKNIFDNHRKINTFICSSLVGYVYEEFNLLPKDTNWSECEPVTFSDDNKENKKLFSFLDCEQMIKDNKSN